MKDKKDVDSAKISILVSANKSAAVLEQFTSQGLSNCPPAYRLLGSYTSKKNIIVLSFHVDYWIIYNVVRNFKTITKVENGNNVASINIPSPAVLKNMSVIIFLQKKDNNKITAATQSVL